MENIKTIAREFDEKNMLTMEELIFKLEYSERKIRYLLKELRLVGKDNGFAIDTIRNQGYILRLWDEQRYKKFIKSLGDLPGWDYSKQEERTNVIIASLLLTEDYITFESLAHILDVSRSTILRDIEQVKVLIEHEGLALITKKKYGVVIKGDECSKRNLFKKFSLSNSDYEEVSEEYWDYLKEVPIHIIEEIIKNVLQEFHIDVSEEGIRTLVDHITVMLYRLKYGNIVSSLSFDETIVSDNYLMSAEKILVELNKKTSFKWNDNEVKLLAVQILGRSIIHTVPSFVSKKLEDEIKKVLNIIDEETESNLSQDQLLQDALLHHIYLLKIRITLKKELKNPIRSMIPIHYMNAILISLRFINLFNLENEAEISLDEVGYIALHFATHFERKKQVTIQNIKRILYISSSIRSTVKLNSIKINETFPNSKVVIKNNISNNSIEKDSIDFIITDIPHLKIQGSNKIFYVDQMITDDNLSMIKNYITQDFYTRTQFHLEDLFFEDIYFYEEELTDYLKIIQKYSRKMTDLGYATEEYSDEVLAREQRLSTVYNNGISGPHSINQNAKIDSIGLIHLKEAVYYEEKYVKTIFMINLKKGHMFLYQDVSDLILWAIESHQKLNEVLDENKYSSFIRMLKER